VKFINLSQSFILSHITSIIIFIVISIIFNIVDAAGGGVKSCAKKFCLIKKMEQG
jgi:hypothetical protein